MEVARQRKRIRRESTGTVGVKPRSLVKVLPDQDQDQDQDPNHKLGQGPKPNQGSKPNQSRIDVSSRLIRDITSDNDDLVDVPINTDDEATNMSNSHFTESSFINYSSINEDGCISRKEIWKTRFRSLKQGFVQGWGTVVAFGKNLRFFLRIHLCPCTFSAPVYVGEF